MTQILKYDLKVVIVDKSASDLRISNAEYKSYLYGSLRMDQGCAAPIVESNELMKEDTQ